MEENGSVSYYEILFQAKSFGDLLSRIDFISEIMSYDEGVVDRLERAKEKTIAKREELEEIQAEAERYKAVQIEKQAQKAAELAEAEALILELETAMDEQQEIYDEIQGDRQILEDQISATLKKIAEEEEAARKAAEEAARKAAEENKRIQQQELDKINSTGTYMWPTTSLRITDTFHLREKHPVTGKTVWHYGADIGCGYGANIFAADSGKVITAEYSSSYGNYIIINHGGGRSTLYGHLSKIKVKVGAMVTKGEVIGLSGSTGISSGPHLHFETRINGTAVDPIATYFSSVKFTYVD